MEEDLRHLPPEERIKKLKELEEKKKKEIEEAEKLIKESENEIKDKQKWLEKVPLPELGKDDLEGLSEEGKRIVRDTKGIKEPSTEEDVEIVSEDVSLDEVVSAEPIPAVEQAQYHIDTAAKEVVYKLSEEPVANLYQEMSAINKEVEEKGYVSRSDEERAAVINSALEKRIKEVYSGSMTQEVAAKSLLTKQLSANLRNMYKGDAGAGKPQDVYHSSGATTNVYSSGHGGGSS